MVRAKPSMRGRIQLPKFTHLLGLPAPNRSFRPVFGPGMRQAMFHGPASCRGSVHNKLVSPERFGGKKTIRRGRTGRQHPPPECFYHRRHLPSPVPARPTGLPRLACPPGHGLKILQIQLANSTGTYLQFRRNPFCTPLPCTILFHQVPHMGRTVPTPELLILFITLSCPRTPKKPPGKFIPQKGNFIAHSGRFKAHPETSSHRAETLIAPRHVPKRGAGSVGGRPSREE